MSFRFEFDAVNKILLLQWEGRLTDELLAEVRELARTHWIATDARVACVSPEDQFIDVAFGLRATASLLVSSALVTASTATR
jgi:hypothetical protein